MLFNSFTFAVFFSVVFCLYLAATHRWQNRLLILASCVFYGTWNWKFLPLMFISITTDFYCARYMDRSQDDKKRKVLLIVSLFVNLALLGFFKYCNFFIENFLSLIACFHPASQQSSTRNFLNIILPLGISFYTFEAISYTVDVYRRVIKPTPRYWDYVLFVIYFPHLVAGPIMRAKDFLPQVIQPRRITPEQFYEGCHLFFWGLFEKIFIADNLAKLVDPVFNDGGPYQGLTVLTALYAFAFQIFCDFDGYSNMARGLGKCMGFEISINFRWPYFATNPSDFWKRWHITLSSWLRDYIYIPLGGNRQSTVLIYRNIAITMILGGLWHGAAWHFVLWGIYHALLIILYKVLTPFFEKASLFNPTGNPFFIKVWHLLKIASFFQLTCLGWLLFRASSTNQAIDMFTSIFHHFSITRGASIAQILFYLSPLLIVQTIQHRNKDLLATHHLNVSTKVVLYLAAYYLMTIWGVQNAKQFIYFQF
ncbi:MAG: MBOAT family protein [Candidatus Omnitrophica bacterium]|nr:MBOAT family protein [Candidatus Omnitrophota bacterium]